MIKIWLLLGCLTMSACNKVFDVPCPSEDEDQGLVVESFFGSELTCEDAAERFDNLAEGVVLQTLEDFQSRISPGTATADLCELPLIDFTMYTLLGLTTQGTGCSRTYRRSVEAKNGGFEYEVTVRECGGCEPLEIATHWVTIPKISDNVIVTFRIKTQKFNS